MENIFAKPPPSNPQHYRLLLQKKEATLNAHNDCFAPAALSPSHLYTPSGILLGQRRTLSKCSAYSTRLNPDSVEDLKRELDKSRRDNQKLQERVHLLEQLLQKHDIDIDSEKHQIGN